jgi:hypothetical protein
LEAGSAFRVPTFRNYTLVNPQVGSPRDLGVRQSFIIGLHGLSDIAQQHMDLCAIQHGKVMDGIDVFQLVIDAFLQYTNFDIELVDYQHLTIFFQHSIKKDYCTYFPIDETTYHTITIIGHHYARWVQYHMNKKQTQVQLLLYLSCCQTFF